MDIEGKKSCPVNARTVSRNVVCYTCHAHEPYFRIGENRDRRWKSPFAKFECHFQSILKRSAASLRNSKPKLFDPALKLAPINPIIRFDFSRLFCFVPSYIIIRMKFEM